MRHLALSAVLLWEILVSVSFAEDVDLGQYYRYYAHSYVEYGEKVCNVYTFPSKKYKYKRKSRPYLSITNRPYKKQKNKIMFEMGLPIKDKSIAKVKIGKRKYTFFVSGQLAFPLDKDEKRVLRALIKGYSVNVSAITEKGYKIQNNYSLRGIRKAVTRINRACK